jgi:hypothetical protein
MGIRIFDWNNDAQADVFVTDMHSDMSQVVFPAREKLKSVITWPENHLLSDGMSIFGNAFYQKTQNGIFAEISDSIGAENYWPWGLSSGDLNADGYQDVFIASSMNYPFRYGVNALLLNSNGQYFVDAEFITGIEPRKDGQTAQAWFQLDCSGIDSAHRECQGKSGEVEVWGALGTRSSVIFDLDDDGDLDIVTNEFNAQPQVLISDLAQVKPDTNFLKIRLRGTASNRNGLGARVTVTTENATYTQWYDGKSGYLSQSVDKLYFGLADSDAVSSVEVTWPSGQHQLISNPSAKNSVLLIKETP